MSKKKISKMNRTLLPDLIGAELDKISDENKRRSRARFILAALSSIPWVGGFLSAMATRDAEKEQSQTNQLQQLWLQEHQDKVQKLGYALIQILGRLEDFGTDIQERIESPEYLALVRKGFRSWDLADTEEKRELIRKLLTSAGAIKLCEDDLIRLFIDWIDKYHEAHFKVIKEIYQKQEITRGEIWDNIKGDRPRDNSSEADLFKLLIDDLSTGHVIRQKTEITMDGRLVKRQAAKRPKGYTAPSTKTSAFENTKPYVLTELGKLFVHYTMEEITTRIEGQKQTPNTG